ncbi:MAG: hypothetical protein RLZZ450_47 [Pseudomonadota bacterium]|jgi:hypothetical protein
MGAVYAVVDKTNGAQLALKRLHSSARDKANALFEREYRTLAGLRHPNIVEVYDYRTDSEGAYYTMELVEGRDLSTRAPLPWRTACRYLRDTASILGLLHARRLLHRDLSPRNLIETPSGLLKLIDFGALAEFGLPLDVVGTPPFVSPEALRTSPLDQRSDLFALGALGYWLITGANAFPARTLNDLPQLWERDPVPPSSLIAMAANDRLEPPPAELDDLLGALLRVDPTERPGSTVELIDRLNTLADLAPEATEQAAAGYLASKAFVGRKRERERFSEALRTAREGKGRVLAIEGDEGVGRTRFLQELAVLAQLEGALTLSLDGSRALRPYAGAELVLTQWFRTLPEPTRAATAPHASVLAHVSPALRELLGVGRLSQLAESAADERVRLQSALLEVFSSLVRERFTVLLVDDLQAIDEESQALFAALAHGVASLRLCLVTSLVRDPQRELSPAITSLRGQATRLRLLPLSAAETYELLHSVFGDAPYLDRLAERLQRNSEGNPAYCLELAQHVVHSGLARYVEGGWVLPTELDADSLPRSRQAGLLTRLERLPTAARLLAQQLSVPHSGNWTLEQASAASALAPDQLHPLIEVLERAGVLRGDDSIGYSTTHQDLREALHGELATSERLAVHARVGRMLLASGDSHEPLGQLRACAHLTRARELAAAYAPLNRAMTVYAGGDLAIVARDAAMLEEVYLLLRDAGADYYVLCGPLSILAVAGYVANRRYAERYGDLALTTQQRVLRLPMARALTPWLGKKLSMIVALVVAGFSLAVRKKRALPLAHQVRAMMTAVSTLTCTAAVCIDPDRAARYAELLEPLTIFGSDHSTSVVYDFSKLLETEVRDHPARSVREVRALMVRLQAPIREFPDQVRRSYQAGCLFALGVIECWRDSTDVLAIADELEHFGPMFAMVAEHLRKSHFAGQGDTERAEACRQRMEVHAVQLGSAWQVESWAPADSTKLALRTHDASVMKRAVQELSRLSAEIPSLHVQERAARVAYLVLRGKYAQAIELSDAGPVDERYGAVGWWRSRGVLARAHNELGQHEQARAICLDAMSELEPDDLKYVAMGLNAPIELALAEAGLGRLALAREQLAKLLADNEPNQSALTLGSLHDALARVALIGRDFATAHSELEQTQALLKPLGIPSLIERCRALGRQIDRAENPNGVTLDSDGALLDNVNHLMTRVQLMLNQHAETQVGERATRCLQVALELSTADEGFVVLAGSEGEPAAHLGNDSPERELVLWAEQNLLDADVDEQTVMTEDVNSQIDSNYKVVGNKRYCVAPLWARQDGQDQVVAALVLGFDNRVPRMPEPAVLRAIASHIVAS